VEVNGQEKARLFSPRATEVDDPSHAPDTIVEGPSWTMNPQAQVYPSPQPQPAFFPPSYPQQPGYPMAHMPGSPAPGDVAGRSVFLQQMEIAKHRQQMEQGGGHPGP
jgi:hypothetical protein